MPELGDIASAFDAAFAELGETEDTVEAEVGEQAAEQADEDVVEQAAEGSEPEGIEDPLADLEVEEDIEEDGPVEVDLNSVMVEVPGMDEPVSFQELRDGYMRRSDYTRKTQEVAAQRKANERAVRLFEAIQSNPVEIVRQMAEEVGLVQPGQQPARAVEFAVFQTADQVEAEIQRRVDEAVQKHPAVLQAREEQARRWVDEQFAAIEEKHGVKLGPKSRRLVMQVASDRGVADLELVYNALAAQKAQRTETARSLAAAAPARPRGHGAADTATPAGAPDSIEDAFRLAEAELGMANR